MHDGLTCAADGCGLMRSLHDHSSLLDAVDADLPECMSCAIADCRCCCRWLVLPAYLVTLQLCWSLFMFWHPVLLLPVAQLLLLLLLH